MPVTDPSPQSEKTGDRAVVWLNGELSGPDSPVLSAWNPGFLLGLGVFETLAFRGGEPVCLTRHHRRLTDGASAIGLDLPPADSLRAAVAETAAANGLSDARIRITVTGDPSANMPRTILVSALPLIVPENLATAVSVPYRRNPTSPITGIKSTSYAESALALRFAKSHGADEAILCDTAGHLSEAASSNLFFVAGGRLHTPPLTTGCLPGITRALVLDLCEKNGLPVVVDLTPPDALHRADEAFLTSSIRDIHPLSSVDGRRLPQSPGPVTAELKSWLDELLHETPDPP